MTGVVIVTVVTIVCGLVQARSVSKELLELNDHINTQFGFDYSNDEDFFSLIGVEAKSGDEGGSYSYEYYDYASPYGRNVKENHNEYDEAERNAGARGLREETVKKKYNPPGERDKQKKVKIIIAEYEESDEYDEKHVDDDYVSEEDGQVDNDLNLLKSKEKSTNNKDIVKFKTNNDDNYVNDYDETHEISSVEDKGGDDGSEEEEEEDYDEEYDYEGNESEEHEESYYESGENEETDEEYEEDNETDDDYYDEDYDYNEEEDDHSVVKNNHHSVVIEKEYMRNDNNQVNKSNKNKEYEEENDTNYVDYLYGGESKLEEERQGVSNAGRENVDFKYGNYEDFNDY